MFMANKSCPGSVEDSRIRLTNRINYYIVEFILAFVSNETVGAALYFCNASKCENAIKIRLGKR